MPPEHWSHRYWTYTECEQWTLSTDSSGLSSTDPSQLSEWNVTVSFWSCSSSIPDGDELLPSDRHLELCQCHFRWCISADLSLVQYRWKTINTVNPVSMVVRQSDCRIELRCEHSPGSLRSQFLLSIAICRLSAQDQQWLESLFNECEDLWSVSLRSHGEETSIFFLEHRMCTSSNSAEQYCPLFQIFDCHPFTGKDECWSSIHSICLVDVPCGARTMPVRCPTNDCENEGTCYVETSKNVSRCVCPSGKVCSFFSSFIHLIMQECVERICWWTMSIFPRRMSIESVSTT